MLRIPTTFASEMEKVARVPTSLALGAVGGAFGAASSLKGSSDSQRVDDYLLRKGVIDQPEWQRRRTRRGVNAAATAALWGGAASLIPSGGARLQQWVAETADAAAAPVEGRLRSVADQARKDLTRTVRQNAQDVGEEVGRGVRTGIFRRTKR